MDEPSTTPEIDRAIGLRLRARREALGLSRQELAVFGDFLPEEIPRFESGSRGLSAAQLCRLADLLEVPLSFFHEPPVASQPASSRGGDDLLQLLVRLSPSARQQVVDFAMELAMRGNARKQGSS